jgi:hypothetical protein
MSSKIYTERTSFGYKITGLLVNVTTQDLKPILKNIKAKTCTIQPKHPRATFKCAYVYVEEQDFQEKIVKISTLNMTIYEYSINTAQFAATLPMNLPTATLSNLPLTKIIGQLTENWNITKSIERTSTLFD